MGSGTTILYMVRHGRAGGNKLHILNGSGLDAPLTKLGYHQARVLAHSWKWKPDVILSSPMKRAMSTARVLAKKYGMRIHTVPMIAEQDCGSWTGKNYYELRKTHPSNFFFDGKKATSYMRAVPGGESWRAIVARARKWLAYVKKHYAGKRIVAFSHGVFMHACVSAHYRIKAPKVFRTDIWNTHHRKFEL